MYKHRHIDKENDLDVSLSSDTKKLIKIINVVDLRKNNERREKRQKKG